MSKHVHSGVVDVSRWQRRLSALAEDHRVPGVTAGILRAERDELVELAHGVVNVATGVEATPDSVFQIGSLTKIWTATLAVQLADDGLFDLDEPVAAVLADLRLSEPEATKRVTMRHLLTHSSGIDGDFFHDTGRGDDCVARYVDDLVAIPQLFSPGAGFSYSNAGFILAGRVIEVLTQQTWDEALRERLNDPLGLVRTSTLAEEAILWRAAAGHFFGDDGSSRRVSRSVLSRSSGPAARINSTAREVLTFARLHLDEGRTSDGLQLVSPSGVFSMQQDLVDVINPAVVGMSRGLGWSCARWDGHRVLQHNGETLGQYAFLRVFPDDRLAIVVLANGGHAGDLFDDLISEMLPELAGFRAPAEIDPPLAASGIDLHQYVGRYERMSISYDVSARDDRLFVRVAEDAWGDIGPADDEFEFLPTGGDGLFGYRPPGSQRWSTALFCVLGGRMFLHTGGRATPRVSQPAGSS